MTQFKVKLVEQHTFFFFDIFDTGTREQALEEAFRKSKFNKEKTEIVYAKPVND